MNYLQFKNCILSGIFALLYLGINAQSDSTIFYDGFEITGQMDPTYWTARPNLLGSDGIVEISQAQTYGGNYAVRIGKSRDGLFTTNALDLTLNLSGEDQVALTFAIHNNDDETHNTAQPLRNDGIFFSSDGGNTFVKVYEFDPDNWCYGYGVLPPIDVDEIVNADPNLTLSSQFVIRFQQYDDEDFSNSSSLDGFYLDDIRVYDPKTEYDTLPFFDDFSFNGKLNSSWTWGDPTLTAPFSSRTTNGWQALTPGPNYAVIMGKRCDGRNFAQNFHTNALDLHLNLLGATQVALEFDLRDNDDEFQPYDGIWFSDDGGETFKQLYQFDFENWCSYTYGKLPPIDIDEFVNANPSLSFTSTCVIRFQQYDDEDFSNSSSLDGIHLDNVHVYDPSVEFVNDFPFLDDFEANGQMGNMWTWSAAYQTSDPLTVTGNGSFGINSTSGINNSYGIFMGKRCDGTFHTNALDLHVNFENTQNQFLSFYLYNNGNEPHNQDGIWVSTDNGLSFTQIDTFDFNTLVRYQYAKYRLDLAKVLSEKGIASNAPETIIRIQQYDDEDFSNSSSLDGIRLDSVYISADVTTSLDQHPAKQIEVYPNPVKDWIHISDKQTNSRISAVTILGLRGEICFHQSYTETPESINIAHLPAGLYMLQVEVNGRLSISKIIKQ